MIEFCSRANLLMACSMSPPRRSASRIQTSGSAVYATEVSREEYLAYTTEETEKVEVMRLADRLGGDIEQAISRLAHGDP